MTDNFNGSMANNLLTSPRPHYTVRSFRTNNTSSPTGEILSLGPIDTNPNRIGTPESDPSTDDTVMTVTTQVSETDREEMEKERLEYQLKGRSLFSVGHPDDIEINNLMTTAPGRGQQLFSTDTISDSRPSQTMGRRSISKPKSPTTPTAPVSPVGSRHSSEMLPLSEFLSQSVDGVKVDNQSTVGLGSRIDDAPQPSYPMSSSFSTSPIPGLSFAVPTGKIRITNASGDLLGYQQQTPVHSDLKYSDQTQAHAEGVVSSHSHETTRSGTDSGVAAFSQDHDENDYLNQRKPIRNYKVFPGRNAFFFGGRIMTSHDFPAFIFAVMLVLIPTGLFHGFSSSYLWHRLSPAVPIIQAYVFIVAFSSMLKTSWTDPGVIPRGIDGDPPIDPPLEPNTFSYYPQGLQRQKEVQVGSHRDSAENPETVSFSKDAMAKAPVAVLVMIFAAIMGLAVGSLACYHFWLATNNRTTHEQLTASMMRPHIVENPFDRASNMSNIKPIEVVNVKVAHIRPKFKNLAEWMQDPDNVYIGRRGVVFVDGSRYPPKDSFFANPFKEGKHGTRSQVVEKYREYIIQERAEGRVTNEQLLELRGKNLGCWCAPQACHGGVLKEMVESLSQEL
ncbi:Eukaryotic peptide chain release factor GTP-binding subunit [Entomortierella lignicola]|nr:Eukaryotic peptide chain release factor GTP-binding subunit [Entomortierella lignicola]